MALLTHKDHSHEELLRYTEKVSVIHQLDNLLTYPAVKKRVDEGKLYLHGWYYHIENGDIEYYDDEDYEFKPLSQK